ncbi:MAG: MFS transporter [Opitutaceae bacterium]|jgi:POT family proton-dependent oligopeptide transporter|nr:MFS transporter [Opitutaceae bacterium]
MKVPRQIPLILGNEACERFSYYGMRSVLATYLTTAATIAAAGTVVGDGVREFPGLGMSRDAATIIGHAFIFGCYITGVLGGWIADRFWGRYKTILRISLLYCLGHGVLALSDLSESVNYKTGCLLTGLVLIALGAGGIKPCVSSFMGDQFVGGGGRLLERAYAAFYWCINLGAVFAFLIIPWVRDHHGYGIAFAIPGIFMAVATFVLWLGRHRYIHAPLATGPGFWQILLYALLKKDRVPGEGFWDAARRRFGEEKTGEIIATLQAVRLFLFIPPFWALYDQSSTTWVMQGKQMVAIKTGIAGIVIGPDQMQAANPALIMVLVPLLTLLLYPVMGKLAAPLRRIGLGMALAAVSFAIVGWLQTRIEAGEALSLAWQLAPYLVLITAEVLVSTTGLELSYTLAPKSMKSTVGSFWLLTVAAGQLIVMAVTHLGGNDGATGNSVTSGRFFFYALLLAATAAIYAVAMRFFRTRPE